VALALVVGCDLVETHPAPDSRRPNVLLVSIDTLRADHLGSYGYARETSPRLDALARESTRYANALAPSPWTLPSHAAMLTGRHPYAIGMLDRSATIPEDVPIVAERFAQAGYRCAGFVDETSRGWIGGERGFARGFESYRHLPEESGDHRYDAARTADAVIEWLEDHSGDSPFFVFAHTKSVHALHANDGTAGDLAYPYSKPRAYLERFASDEDLAVSWRDARLGRGVGYLRGFNERLAIGHARAEDLSDDRLRILKSLYDSGIYYVDEQIGRILDTLEKLGHAEDTIVVVTADHGEAFLEHRLFLHKELYDELLHVPLIVHVPGEAPSVVDERATLMDVVPLLLAKAGIEAAPIAAEPDREEHFAFYRDRDGYYTESYALRGEEWTLITQRLGGEGALFQNELYRATDARQREPVTDRPDEVAAMLARLQTHLGRAPEQVGVPIELDAATLEHLRALGYVD
jgi:arylsulfatase A-like enzyme